MTTCTVCGLEACGLASHRISKAVEAREDLEIISKVVQEHHPELSHAQLVVMALEAWPQLYDELLSKADPWDAARMDAFVDLDRLADQLQYENRNLTRAQAVAKAVSMRPEVYDRVVLMSATGTVQQETAR